MNGDYPKHAVFLEDGEQYTYPPKEDIQIIQETTYMITVYTKSFFSALPREHKDV